MERGTLFNLPNSVSLSRLLLAFAFVIFPEPWQRVVLIAAAGITDVLDGWLARRSRSASVAGALIDPIADRLFVLAAVSSYLIEGKLGTGQYFIFLARDIATAVGFIVARFIPGLSAASFRARFLGKAVTVLQLATLFAVLIAPSTVSTLIFLIAAVSVLSIVDYTAALERARRASVSKGLLLVLAGLAGSAEAQGLTPEARIDGIIASTPAVHAGFGLVARTGTYLRTGAVGAAGASRDGLSGRIELFSRFHLDPFRESRWAPYAGGGLGTRFDEDRRSHRYLLIFAGIDGPVSNGLTASFEAGLGGGGRIGMIIRRAEKERR